MAYAFVTIACPSADETTESSTQVWPSAWTLYDERLQYDVSVDVGTDACFDRADPCYWADIYGCNPVEGTTPSEQSNCRFDFGNSGGWDMVESDDGLLVVGQNFLFDMHTDGTPGRRLDHLIDVDGFAGDFANYREIERADDGKVYLLGNTRYDTPGADGRAGGDYLVVLEGEDYTPRLVAKLGGLERYETLLVSSQLGVAYLSEIDDTSESLWVDLATGEITPFRYASKRSAFFSEDGLNLIMSNLEGNDETYSLLTPGSETIESIPRPGFANSRGHKTSAGYYVTEFAEGVSGHVLFDDEGNKTQIAGGLIDDNVILMQGSPVIAGEKFYMLGYHTDGRGKAYGLFHTPFSP